MIEQSPQPEPSREHRREVSRMKLQALISGNQQPSEVEGLQLHSSSCDPERPGRIRFSYRSADHEEGFR